MRILIQTRNAWRAKEKPRRPAPSQAEKLLPQTYSFLTRLFLAGLGEDSGTEEAAAGDSAAAAEASFLACLCFAGLGEVSGLAAGEGDWAERVARENPINATMRSTGLFMSRT